MTGISRPSVIYLAMIFFIAALFAPIPPAGSDELCGIPGAISGSVCSEKTGAPVADADIALCRSSEQETLRASLQNGSLSDRQAGFWRTRTGSDGAFEIPSVELSSPSNFVLLVWKSGYRPLLVEDIVIVSGAGLAPRLFIALEQVSAEVKEPSAVRADDLPSPFISLPPMPAARNRGGHVVFATREGLVGSTTSNGHVIAERDHFVALPSKKSLCKSDASTEYQVRLTYNNRSVTVPVWDVGPWNTKDDYWNPASLREMWTDLAQYLPEAQAAFQDGYNGGRDGYGRTVKNAAGIDLADGVYWDDLAMTGNDWIEVQYLWQEGSSQIKGDIDCDGVITSNDGDLCLKITLGLPISYTASPTAHTATDNERSAADMNGDGSVGVDDSVLILKASVNAAKQGISALDLSE